LARRKDKLLAALIERAAEKPANSCSLGDYEVAMRSKVKIGAYGR
jgi:hypothetical protein